MQQFYQGRASWSIGGAVPAGQGWTYLGTRCAVPGGGADADPLPAFTLEDFRRLPLPEGEWVVQPAGGRGLIRMPTNVYASVTDAVVIPTSLLGFDVQVRATPVAWQWTFGDEGTVGPTTDPGGGYPSLRNAYAFESSGEHEIVQTVFYAGEYSVEGGPWIPVDGQAEVVGDPVGFEVVTGRNVLVNDPLP